MGEACREPGARQMSPVSKIWHGNQGQFYARSDLSQKRGGKDRRGLEHAVCRPGGKSNVAGLNDTLAIGPARHQLGQQTGAKKKIIFHYGKKGFGWQCGVKERKDNLRSKRVKRGDKRKEISHARRVLCGVGGSVFLGYCREIAGLKRHPRYWCNSNLLFSQPSLELSYPNRIACALEKGKFSRKSWGFHEMDCNSKLHTHTKKPTRKPIHPTPNPPHPKTQQNHPHQPLTFPITLIRNYGCNHAPSFLTGRLVSSALCRQNIKRMVASTSGLTV